MKVVKYDPKETFGLAYRVYPFIDEDLEVPGWAFSYAIFDDGRLEIFGHVIDVDVAKKYLDGLSKAISLAKGEG